MMHFPLHPLSHLRAIDAALADLIHKHESTQSGYRCVLARMISQLQTEIANRGVLQGN